MSIFDILLKSLLEDSDLYNINFAMINDGRFVLNFTLRREI